VIRVTFARVTTFRDFDTVEDFEEYKKGIIIHVTKIDELDADRSYIQTLVDVDELVKRSISELK